MRKVKFALYCSIIFILYEVGLNLFINPVDAQDEIWWNGDKYLSAEEERYDRGRIVYYSTNIEVCNSWVLIPGTALLPKPILALAYGSALIYLFCGIGIISDIFMTSIEKITAK